MALLARLKRWRGLSLLREQVRAAPSPASYGGLAERLIALGEIEEALRVAEEGLSRFPDSERLAHVRLFTRKGRLSDQIRKLREDLHRRPSPLAYSQLAQVYRDLGSVDEALAVANECAERFPLNEAAYLIQGEIRVERFRRDLIAKDALIAEAALGKVTRLNEHSATAHLLLAELHWLTGNVAECRRRLRSVLAITPTARDVQEFLRELDGAGDSASPVEESLQDLAEKVEAGAAFANPTDRFPRIASRAPSAPGAAHSYDAASVHEHMADLCDTPGLRNAVVLGRDGASAGAYARSDGLTAEHFVELVCAIRDTADDASRRMDTGTLLKAEIEGPGGNVVLTRVRGLTIAILFSEPLRADRAAEIVSELLARSSSPGREAAHA